jgi:hypothetical protein
MITQAEMTAEQVIGAIGDSQGNLSVASRRIGCSRPTLYSFIAKHPTCQDAVRSSREKMIDSVESILYSKALEGEAWAVCFFLKTQAKHRGYVERSEHRLAGEDGGPIKIEPYDYNNAIAVITARPGHDSETPSEG